MKQLKFRQLLLQRSHGLSDHYYFRLLWAELVLFIKDDDMIYFQKCARPVS